jgi:hypothetical protein
MVVFDDYGVDVDVNTNISRVHMWMVDVSGDH